ncbi:MAG TPA: VIT and VWA domain-containing protein [Kofleriaceae bacterium]|nr:VIT and VWA domain-containing protein [Kofleriaceae bacterium]
MQTRFVHAAAVAVALGLAIPATAGAQVWAPENVQALMIARGERGEDLAPSSSSSSPLPLPLVEERLRVDIDGQHATSTLLQVYQSRAAVPIEGRYTLRAGTGSHVEGFAYWNGEAKIVGEVFERETARRVYENVTTRRRDPGLLEQEGEGAFAFRVSPIAPSEKKRIELRWAKWLDRRAQTVRYHAPITRPDAEIVVSITGTPQNLRSPTHALRVEKLATGVRLRADGARGRAGELVLEWDVAEPAWTPSAYLHPNGTLDGWFALSLAAPDLPASAVTAKDVTIVIDRSGSMKGEPMAQAKAAAIDMIRRLDAADRVNVVAFSDEVDPLFKAPQPLDADTRAHAIGFVDRLHDGGGTDIALALGTAIASQDAAKARPRVVVFMTDGQSDVEKAMAAARTDTGDVRLFTLGLGKDVNSHLLSRLAATKRGRFVHIEQAAAIQTEVGRLAALIARPLLVDVSVEVDGVQAVKLYPRSLPDLFAQDELLVTGRFRGPSTGAARLTIRGKLAGKPVAFTRSVDLATAPARPWLGRLWAQARVAHLLEEMSLGGKQPELVEEVVELALAYNFVTPYTAFLAIPESELGDQASTVAAARARKRQIRANNPDAAALDGDAPARHAVMRSAADVDADDDAGDGGDADEEGEALPASRALSRRAHGCAGCASSGGAAPGLLALALAIAGLLVRPRRRR